MRYEMCQDCLCNDCAENGQVNVDGGCRACKVCEDEEWQPISQCQFGWYHSI